ncbi:MAG: hypothetical protein KZQ93_12780 [Candidatus Thiodiazotropha sp. (ex Monitilora ramsayi)]|nr:hypothetical protein [Candidatus Thiodiazotropha sp. (ex Monitilora ramsayi)]
MSEKIDRPHKVIINMTHEEDELITAFCNFTGKDRQELIREIVLEQAEYCLKTGKSESD